MWEIFTCGLMPYDQMRNADVVDFVCTSNKRLRKPDAAPEKIYQIMMECWHKVSDKVSLILVQLVCTWLK